MRVKKENASFLSVMSNFANATDIRNVAAHAAEARAAKARVVEIRQLTARAAETRVVEARMAKIRQLTARAAEARVAEVHTTPGGRAAMLRINKKRPRQ